MGYKGLQEVTGIHKGLLKVRVGTRGYKRLWGVTRRYRGLQGVAGD